MRAMTNLNMSKYLCMCGVSVDSSTALNHGGKGLMQVIKGLAEDSGSMEALAWYVQATAGYHACHVKIMYCSCEQAPVCSVLILCLFK